MGSESRSGVYRLPMLDGEISTLEAAIWSVGSMGILYALGVLAVLFRRHQEDRDEQIRADAYRRGWEDAKAKAPFNPQPGRGTNPGNRGR